MHFTVSITMMYYNRLGVDADHVLLQQCVIGAAGAVSDPPAGYLAARFGIRRILTIGIVMQIVQSLLFTQCQDFFQLCGVGILTGCSWSMTTGITKTIVKRAAPQDFSDFTTRAVRYRGVGQIVSTIVGGILAGTVGLKAPVYLQPIPFVVALVVTLRVDKSFELKSRLSHPMWHSIKAVGRTMLIDKPAIRWVVALSAIVNASILASLWFVQPTMERAGISLEWFGWVFSIRTVATIVLTHVKDHLVRKCGNLGTQAMLVVCVVISAAVAGFPGGLVGAIAVLLASAIAAAFTDPILTRELDRWMPESVHNRTTEFSVCSALQTAVFTVLSQVLGSASKHMQTTSLYLLIAGISLCLGGFCLHRYRLFLRN